MIIIKIIVAAAISYLYKIIVTYCHIRCSGERTLALYALKNL